MPPFTRRAAALVAFGLIAACAPQTMEEAMVMEPEPIAIEPVAEPMPTVASPPPAQPVVIEPNVLVRPQAAPTVAAAPESAEAVEAPTFSRQSVEQEDTAQAMAVPEAVEEAIVVEPEEPYFNVDVSFATNRTRSDDPDAEPADMFTNEDGPLIWGQASVSIPITHERGQLESPGWLQEMIFGMNPERHIMLQEVLEQDRETVLATIRAELGDSTTNAILMYVHGYSTTFEKAARRMAQMKHDLEFDGPAMFFSWPSKGQTAAYPHDSNMVDVTYPRMEEMLRTLADEPADRIVVIAHSMGTQVLTYALRDLIRTDPQIAARFDTIILAAPDIDERVFKNQLVPAFAALPQPVTLYASSNDTALKASRRFNGYPRIGDASEVLGPMDNVVVIDASNVVSDFFGHRYFAENTSILSDIYNKVIKGEPVNVRTGLESIRMENGTIYRISGAPN